MSTPKSKLHDFHLKLCRYASENLAEHLDDVAFSEPDLQKYGALIEYVRQCGDDGLVEGPDMSGLLLNDEEFDRLTRWARSLDLSTVERPVPPPRKWDAVSQYHDLALKCVPESKKWLPDWEKRWTTTCVQFASGLERPNLELTEGIEIVRKWCRQICRVLDAMEKPELIPVPAGRHPTPTNLVAKQEVRDSFFDDPYVQRVVEAIEKLGLGPDGKHKKPDVVIPKAAMNPARCRRILRELEKRGRYTGFTKQRSVRFQAGE